MKISTYLSDPVSINLPGAAGVPATPQASGADFGATIGAATQQAGQALIRTGVVLGDINRRLEGEAKEERNKQVSADTASAASKFDFSADYLDMTTKAGDRPEDFGSTVGAAYDAKMDAYLDTIKDNDVRRETRKNLASRRESYVQQANGFQAKSNVDASMRDANDGINVQTNRVRTDPSMEAFNDASKNIDDIISTRPGLTGNVREAMRQQAQYMLARRRFEARIEGAALDPVALAGIQKEMNSPEWQGKLNSQDFDKLNDNITTLSHAANSQEVSLARSAIETLKQRNNDPSVLIPDEELNAQQAVVNKSGRAELMSQFALIRRTQQIYKEFQGLPPDQMRAKIEEMRKRGGIAGLPQEIQDGITEGSRLTNGRVPSEFLAGLVNAEYSSADIAAGNYGKTTGLKLADGRRASDATGIAQFISTTWRETLRSHAAELGIDPNKSDAELDAMRKDPKLSIKAAALHALDNMQKMESRLGRSLSDGDVYFAHLLGVNGGIRFLQGADAQPNAPAKSFVDDAQVEANRPVFYDESGRPRTASQVRVMMTDKMMNGPSRVDYAGVKAGEKYLAYATKERLDDPITYAQSTGRFGAMGGFGNDADIKQRAVTALQVASMYGIPQDQFKPLTKGEVESFTNVLRDGTAEQSMEVMSKVATLGTPSLITAANKQLGQKDSLYGFAAGAVAVRPDMKSVALDVMRGEKRMKTDKDAKSFPGVNDEMILSAWNQEVGKSIVGTDNATMLRQAALAYYIEHSVSKGDVQPGVFNADAYKNAIHAVLGGNANPGGLAIGSVNGAKMLLPPGLSEGTFTGALRRMNEQDYTALSMFGGPPRYRDGSPVTPAEIARSGQFEIVGNGRYRIKLADGSYALSAAYKDGSADFYVFYADPARLNEAAARQPNVAPLPPTVPGVQPAKPRVIE